MNYFRIICLMIFTLASTLPVTHAEPIDQIEDVKPYYPMITGSAWTYSDLAGGSTTTVVESCAPDNEVTSVCTLSEIYSRSLERNYLRYAFSGDSLFLVGAKTKNRNWQAENRMMLKSPLRAGDIWEAAERTQVSKFRVVAIIPSMQVTAGTFKNVIMVERQVVIKGKPMGIGYDYYAPNVGLIGVGGKPDPEAKLLKELTEFRSGASERQSGNESEQPNLGRQEGEDQHN
jgi:hypothetical protein